MRELSVMRFSARCARRSGFFLLVSCLTLGCTLAPRVNVPDSAVKAATTGLTAGAKGVAKEAETELVRIGDRYRDEFQATVKELTESVQGLVRQSNVMPRAFGEGVTDRLLNEPSIHRALEGVSVLALSPQHLADSVEKGPAFLSAKLTDLQTEFTRADGFITQQRTALLDAVAKERMAIAETIRQERVEAIKDLDSFTKHKIEEIFSELRLLIKNALWLVILLVVVLWGLPFGAGLLVGRHMRKRP